MKRSDSTRRASAANDQQAFAASPSAAPQTLPESQERETATPTMDAQARHELIAVAAYFLAEGRGFASGFALDDWLRAEAEIDANLQRARAPGEEA